MKLRDFICCPGCNGRLEERAGQAGAGSLSRPTSRHVCTACGAEYPVRGGVVDFLPDVARGRSLAHRIMGWERIVSIQERRWWRGRRGFSRFEGIPLAEERSLIGKILAIRSGDGVLDLACGRGFYARRFAREDPQRYVIGLDFSWRMLRRGAAPSGGEGIANLALVRGDAHQLPFSGRSLDAANCSAALHLFADPRRVLEELHRVIKPGGRLSTAVVRQRATRRPSGARRTRARRIGFRGFREEELEALLDAAGFEPSVHHARGSWMIAGGLRRD